MSRRETDAFRHHMAQEARLRREQEYNFQQNMLAAERAQRIAMMQIAQRDADERRQREWQEQRRDQIERLQIENDRKFDRFVVQGVGQFNLGHYREAKDYYTQAIALKPNAAVFYSRGLSYLAIEDFKSAISDFNASISRDATNGDSYSRRGFAYLRKGFLEEALQDYQHVNRLRPNQYDYLGYIGFLEAMLAQPNARREPLERAIGFFNRYFRLDQRGVAQVDNPNVRQYLAVSLELLVRNDEAITEYDNALALIPDLESRKLRRAELLILKGELLLKMERVDNAREVFTQVTDIEPTLFNAITNAVVAQEEEEGEEGAPIQNNQFALAMRFYLNENYENRYKRYDPLFLHFIQKACAANHVESYYRLALSDYRRPKRLAYYQRAAELGHAISAHSAGVMLRDGDGITVNKPEALIMFRRASALNHAEAAFCAGRMLDTGDGVPRDYTTAVVQYRIGTAQNHAGCLYELARSYNGGHGVVKNKIEARRLFLLASRQNHKPAALTAGKMCYHGWHGPVNYEESFRCFQLAQTLTGDDQKTVLFYIALSHYMGHGTAYNKEQAKNYFKRDTQQSHALSVRIAGRVYKSLSHSTLFSQNARTLSSYSDLKTVRKPVITTNGTNLIVEVHANTQHLFYRIGRIARNGDITFGNEIALNRQGYYFDVAMNNRNDVVLVYESITESKIYYLVGRLNRQNTMINWHNSAYEYESNGRFPSVTMDDSRNVVTCYQSGTWDAVRYQTGIFPAGAFPVRGHSIDWKTSDGFFRLRKGHHCARGMKPSIAMCTHRGQTKVLVVFEANYSNNDMLKYEIGVLQPDKTISWAGTLYCSDLNLSARRPSVSLNRNGRFTVSFYSTYADSWKHPKRGVLCYIKGSLGRGKTLTKADAYWRENMGTKTSVALLDSGRMVEVHEFEKEVCLSKTKTLSF